jgi:hypothetical membrane protein
MDARKLTYRAGGAATAVIVLAALAAALAFSGPGGARYSILNHDISVLGEPDLSAWATPFNWGLRIGGTLLAGFMLGLGVYVGRRRFYLVTLAGLVAASGVTLVGIYSANYQHLHRLAAIIVFAGGLATVTGFTLFLLFVRQDKLARWLAIPSAAAMLAFAAFLFLPYTANTPPLLVFFAGPPGEVRPILWLPSLLEWLVLLVVLAWVLTLSLYLYVQDLAEERRARSPIPSPQPYLEKPGFSDAYHSEAPAEEYLWGAQVQRDSSLRSE